MGQHPNQVGIRRVITLALRLLSSRFGLAILVAVALYGWHVLDKRQAVREARAGLVRETELAAAMAERDQLRHQIAAARQARERLQEKAQAEEGRARRFALELEEFERETEVDPDGLVSPHLLRRLRSR